ncbi:MAG TPA: glycoside hydrolase family 47 protein [Rhizomicrobium sp.]|jgi:mannosyl-oligosaccharide alpha-1,2-mannosidase|nr:glycoside hydrolase family 47 protein [Rhizomicrobium sp.]
MGLGIHRRSFLKALAASPAATTLAFPSRSASSWKALAEDVRAQMRWAWLCYRRCCFGADQIKPVSGRGEAFFFAKGPSLGLTIVEALDTLYVMGLDRQIVEGLRWLYRRLNFDVDGEVQVFETGIRMVGGLLSGWRGTGEKRLLALAKDLADRLAPAFEKSPTGMPYRFVNLKTGAVRGSISYPAEIGTYIAEWGTLGKATGDPRYYDMAKRALKALFERRSKIDLIADAIDVETGEWKSRRATIGPPSDSYFEYLWDGWRLFGDADLKRWYDIHAAAIAKHQSVRKNGRLWFAQVDFETGAALDRHQSELAAFYAGLLAQGGDMERGKDYLESWAAVQSRYGVLPEGYDFEKSAADRRSNALRPEFVDSCLAMFLIEPNERWRELARIHYENMKATSRAPYGFTVIDDIGASPMKQGDLCPGYWWSEQMKYYYLLFSDSDRFDYKNNYLSTEGNVLVGLK